MLGCVSLWLQSLFPWQNGGLTLLLIGRAAVVRPSRAGQDALGPVLKVLQEEKIVRLGHLCSGFLPPELVFRDLLLLGRRQCRWVDRPHEHVGRQSVDRVRRVQRLECLRGVFAGVLEDCVLATGVRPDELCEIIDLALEKLYQYFWREQSVSMLCSYLDDYPAVIR